jgi:uncharacterized membrane protein YgaE (UPF0421/DUF939 family)
MGKGMAHVPHIGMLIIKSALGVLICFAIYFIRGKQGTPFYSALAVLWCIQNQTKNTVGNALQRTVGTGIGAAYGLALNYRYMKKMEELENIKEEEESAYEQC